MKRFWDKVDIRGPDECWPWTAGTRPSGYGAFTLKRGHSMRSHRLAYELAHGPIPQGIKVLHDCDNPPCCNPAHLFLGTNADNSADMVAKQRQARGERCARAKLTAQQAADIRCSGKSISEIARTYGVDRKAVRLIKQGQTWRHI